MKELEGYNCKIFTDDIEPKALQQIYEVIKKPEWKDLKVRIMSDVHFGSGICIGFVSEVGKYVDPDYIGVDIGCSISTMFVDKPVDPNDYQLFEHRLRKEIPTGTEICGSRQFVVKDFLAYLRSELQKAYQNTHGLTYLPDFNSQEDLERWLRDIGMDLGVFYKSVGSIGGGNHFLEYDEGSGKYAITVHTGSRNLGIKVNKYWKSQAQGDKIPKEIQKAIQEEVKSRPGINKREIKPLIDAEIKKWREENIHLGFLSGENLRGYLTDMVIACSYAAWNHKVILDKALEIYTKLTAGREIERITTRHNYIDFSSPTPIIRKGAVSARDGEILILPFNMRDGLAVCRGKGNTDWLSSCAHGAGRKMSRGEAKSRISLKDFEKEMAGIYSTSVCRETLDEAPGVYKDKDEVLKNLSPTIDVLYFLKPKINIKAIK